MARSKITVDSYVNENFSDSIEELSPVIDVGLVIQIDLEFEGQTKISLSNLLDGLEGDNFKNRKKELIQFVNFVRKMKGSGTSKKTRVEMFVKWVRLSNEIDCSMPLYSKEIVLAIQKHYQKQHNQKAIGYETLKGMRKQFRIILRDCFLLEQEQFNVLFPALKQRTGKLVGATINDSIGNAKAFSDSDFRLIIALLLNYARDFQQRFKSRCGLEHLKINPPIFDYERGKHRLNTQTILSNRESPFNTSKYLANRATVYFLLVFISITGANLSPLMRAKRRDVTISKGERDLLTILITDKRKKKLKEPKPYLMKKFQERLYQEVIEHSKLVDPSDDALLFPYVQDDNSFKTFSSSLVSSAIQAYRKQGPIGEFGEILNPTPKKLRDSHGQQFDDLMTRAAALGNSLKVAARYYSDGNPEENTDVLQSGMNSYTLSLITGHELSKVDQHFTPEIDIKMLDVEEGNELLKTKNATNTMTGGVCKNAKSSEEAERHKRKLTKLKLINEEDFLCNNILACFTCPNHIFVEDLDYVYVLLSFYQFLCDAMYTHEAGGLFGSKELVDKAISEIDWMKKHRISPDIVIKVERKIKQEGVHPLWSSEFMEN